MVSTPACCAEGYGFGAQPSKRASCVLLIMRLPYSSGWAYTVNRICLGRPSLSSSRGRQIGTWLPLVSSAVAGGKSDGLL